MPKAPVVPKPTTMRTVAGQAFRLAPDTTISLRTSDPGARGAATALADLLRASTGYPLPIVEHPYGAAHRTIQLKLVSSDELGAEGYRLDVTHGAATIRAHRPAGLFYGVQTLRQLLPASVEKRSVQPGPWTVRRVHVTDEPRFAWRGAMLDVARHFFSVSEVERYLDLMSMYKMNVLHLHLADDQGWRIQIPGWPRLTSYGGSTEVGGGPGGYYTTQDFESLVAYAGARHITIVPEIDMPSHINAALASYPELNCDGVAPPLYTGTDVGFSSFCIDKPVTYRFIDDVVTELARISPSSYIHLGGDEAHSTSHDDYVTFENRVSKIVAAHDLTMVGWEEIATADPSGPTVAQHWWTPADARAAVAKGMKLVMSPADKAYIDMKYDANTRLGLDWAGYTSVRESYEWDPGTWVTGVPESAVLGVEAALWSETLENIDDIEYLAFPRLPGIAELGWSQTPNRSWAEYRQRLGAQAPRWDALSVNYYRSPQVPWKD